MTTVKQAFQPRETRKNRELSVLASGKESRWSRAHLIVITKTRGNLPRFYVKTLMTINKITCWNVPCGLHQAIIQDARIVDTRASNEEAAEKVPPFIRLILELTSLAHPLRKYVVKKTYKVGEASEFIKDMEHLLGTRCEMLATLAGELIPEALGQLLNGLEVDVEVEHHVGRFYDKPYCLVTQIKRRGELIEAVNAKQ